MDYVDLRSDTVTWPTPLMRKAMAEAKVGDDVWGDDPTIQELEALGAQMMGKEASIFVPSGTMGNQLALYTHSPRGTEVVLGEQSHIVQHEAGAASVIAGVQLRTIDFPQGLPSATLIKPRLQAGDLHRPRTSLVCIENALAGGRVVPLSVLAEVYSLVNSRGLPVHMDGARIFNAAAALNCSAAQVAASADSIMFCLSKGLCAPIGSLLAGSREFIAAAHSKRKLLGGALRQVGILGAAGLVALKEMTGRLFEDHAKAKTLSKALSQLPGVELVLEEPEINMVFFRILKLEKMDAQTQEGAIQLIIRHMKTKGVLIIPPEENIWRLVTHYWIKEEDLNKVVREFAICLERIQI